MFLYWYVSAHEPSCTNENNLRVWALIISSSTGTTFRLESNLSWIRHLERSLSLFFRKSKRVIIFSQESVNSFIFCMLSCIPCSLMLFSYFVSSQLFLRFLLFSLRILCKFFAHGACLKGEHCEFSHDWKDPTNNVSFNSLPYVWGNKLSSTLNSFVLLMFSKKRPSYHRFAPTTRKESALTEVDAGTNMSKLPGLIHLLHLRPLCLGHLLLQLPTLLPVLFFLVSRKEIWAQFLLHL